jgi:hypothetical protein
MRDVTQVAGLLYGYWSIGAIELDRLMDEAILSPSQAQMAADEWLRQLHGTLFGAAPLANEKTIPNSSSDVFGALTSAFMRTLQTYDTLCRNRQFPHWDVDVRKSFYHATAGLLAGQMRSLRQMEPDDAQGWPWYRASILNSKNVQFLLAPLNLWRVEEGSEKHLSRFMRQFECLNRTYLHYQLIDDVADLAEDTAQGIVGAPAAILFSQGALAREALRYTEGAQLGNSISNNRMLVEAIRNSELLAEGLAGAPPFDRFRQCFRGGVQCSSDGEDYLRCALGNCEADLSLTISALAQRRDEEAQAFLEALQQRQFGPAQSYLLRSGAPNRILNAVGNDSAIIALRRALDEDIASAGSQLLYILESLMRKTHRAALSVVRHGND